MYRMNIVFRSERWTGHTAPVDRFVLLGVLLAGALAFLIVGLVVL